MDKHLFLLNVTIEELIDKTSDKILEKIKDLFPSPPSQEEYLTCKQAAKLLQLSLPTLHGIIPSYRLGRNIRYKKSEIEGVINKGLRFKSKQKPNEYSIHH